MKRFSIFILILAFAACRKEKGESNEEELITTMILTVTPEGAGTPIDFRFEDMDGPGGDPATQDNIVLEPNTTYQVKVTLLNETVSPAVDITGEVEEENVAHRFYYELSAGSNITISDLNNDDDGVTLGTTGVLTTTSSATGVLTVTLRHYPGNPPDKQIPDPVNSPKSSTDITVSFATRVL